MFSLFIQVRRSKGNSNQRNVNFQLWIKKTLIIISSVVCAVETGFTSRHLHQHVEEHKRSTIGNHVKDAHGKDPETSQSPFRHHYQCRIQRPLPMPNPDIEIREGPGLPQKCFRPLGPQFGVKIRGGGRPHRPLSPGSATDYKHFKILKKCQSKLDCLIFEMLWLDPREAILFHCKYLLLSYRFYRLSVSFIIRVLFPCKYFRVFSQYLIIPFTVIYKYMLIFYFSTWKWPSNGRKWPSNGRNVVNFYSPKTCYFFPK